MPEQSVPAVTPVNAEVKTVGVSPKVIAPVLVGVMVAIFLLIIGEKDTAVAVLLSACGFGGVGYGASPGAVKITKR